MPYAFPTEEDEQLRELLFTPCNTKEEVKQWVYTFLDIELPDVCVDPESNSNPLDMVWTCYAHVVHGPASEDVSRYLFYSSRFGGKTLCESIIEVMLLLHAGIDITHLAAIERQSRDCQKYIAKFFNLPRLKGILSGDNKKEKMATYYVPRGGGPILLEREWKTLPEGEQLEYKKVSNTVEVIVATLQSCNGKHSALLCLDEIDVMSNPEAYEESKNIPTPTYREDGHEYLPITLLTSTRKFNFGLVSKEIAEADKTGLVVRNWNILDICKACPKSRHLPELPKREMYISEELLSSVTPENYQELPNKEKEKYTKIECFEGCVSNCKILPACKTYLATRQTSTSKFLKPIGYIQNQIKTNSIDKALAQLLCRKPSTSGLIYPHLSKQKHLLLPWQAFERISGEKVALNKNMSKAELVVWLQQLGGEWYAGLDWGFVHLFCFVMGIKLGNVFYVTHALGLPDLSPSQKIDECEPYKKFDPKVWADTEDPAMIKAFKQAGWRMAKWQKKAGSVDAGHSTVGMKLKPTLDREPELFFVKDVGEDPMMDLLFLHLQEYHYKLGPDGKPTKKPSDEDKDFPDATRYLIHNLFDIKGKLTVIEEQPEKQKLIDIDGNRVYKEETWMTQRISELTGQEERPPATSRPPMVVETFEDYYKKSNEEDKKDRSGKHRGIIWNFD